MSVCVWVRDYVKMLHDLSLALIYTIMKKFLFSNFRL